MSPNCCRTALYSSYLDIINSAFISLSISVSIISGLNIQALQQHCLNNLIKGVFPQIQIQRVHSCSTTVRDILLLSIKLSNTYSLFVSSMLLYQFIALLTCAYQLHQCIKNQIIILNTVFFFQVSNCVELRSSAAFQFLQ